MDVEIKELKKFEDPRGFLVEYIKGPELEEREFGQSYLATIKPNFTRGNHYHETKQEIFTIMSGKAKIILEDIKTKERKEIIIDSQKDKTLKRIKFGSFIAHAIKNISNDLVVVVSYNTKLYNYDAPDDKKYMLIEK